MMARGLKPERFCRKRKLLRAFCGSGVGYSGAFYHAYHFIVQRPEGIRHTADDAPGMVFKTPSVLNDFVHCSVCRKLFQKRVGKSVERHFVAAVKVQFYCRFFSHRAMDSALFINGFICGKKSGAYIKRAL